MTSSNLDIAFCVDNTGSMSSYIVQVQQNITKIIEEIVKSEKADVQFALVHYRDHTDAYLVKSHEFTNNLKSIKKYVNQMAADGGGDGPEAVAPAFKALNELKWRKISTKIAIFIADAPPHGLGENGDSYPNGDPNGIDPLEEVNKLTTKEVIIYSVGCEPGINSFIFARAFMKGVSGAAGGKYLPLAQAKILSDVIIYGAREELNLDKYADQIEQEVTQIKTRTPTMKEEDVYTMAATNLAALGLTTPKMDVDNILSETAFEGSDAFKSPTLLSAKQKLTTSYPSMMQQQQQQTYPSFSSFATSPASPRFSALRSVVSGPSYPSAPSYSSASPFVSAPSYPSAASYSSAPSPYNGASMAAQTVSYNVSPITSEQVQRLHQRKQNSSISKS